MSDAFRQTFPIPVVFVDGELPTASKFNVLATQSRSGQGLLRSAIGDTWNQSGDILFNANTNQSLMIPNLARHIGAAKYLSPRMPYLPNIAKYTHVVPASDNGLHEFQAAFPPAAGSTYLWAGGATLDAIPKATQALVVATNNWYVDTTTGRVYTYDALATGWTLTYKPVVAGDISGDIATVEDGADQTKVDDTATFNIIPDLNTQSTYNGFLGVKIKYAVGTDNTHGYYIYLPPRAPLTDNTTNSTSGGRMGSRQPNITSNFATTPDSDPLRLWQSNSADASVALGYAEHYRYLLPQVVTNYWSSGSAIPAGVLYLWDFGGTKTILEGITCYAETCPNAENLTAVPRPWVLFVPQGTPLDTYLSSSVVYTNAVLQNSSHATTYYPAAGLKIIATGTSITMALSSLMRQFRDHDHSATYSPSSKLVDHGQMKGLFDPGTGPVLIAPSGVNDDHPQYLNRRGYGSRDIYGGGMLGDLLMNSKTPGYNNQSGVGDNNSSYAIHFGRHDAGGTDGGVTQSGSRIFGWGLTDGGVPSQELVLDNYVAGKAYGSIDIFDPERTVNTQVQFRWNNSTKNVNLQKYGTGDLVIGADNNIAFTKAPVFQVAPSHIIAAPLIWKDGDGAIATSTNGDSGGCFDLGGGHTDEFMFPNIWPNGCTITLFQFRIYVVNSTTQITVYIRRKLFAAEDTLGNETMYASSPPTGGNAYRQTTQNVGWYTFGYPTNTHNTLMDLTQHVISGSVYADKEIYISPVVQITATTSNALTPYP